MDFFKLNDDATKQFASPDGVRRFEAALLASLEEKPDLGKLAQAHITALKITEKDAFRREGNETQMIEAIQKILGISPKNIKPNQPH